MCQVEGGFDVAISKSWGNNITDTTEQHYASKCHKKAQEWGDFICSSLI